MNPETCEHVWEMTNVKSRLIVMKKCFHCSKVSTCFIAHRGPPIGTSHEGEHFWNYMESDPSFHFDIKCTKCDKIIDFDELVGIMVCTGCDETCEVDILRKKLVGEGSNVHIALGQRPLDERKALSAEKLAILQEYYHQQGKHLANQVEIVSHELVRDIDKCYAEVIEDPRKFFRLK
jgi:hypothetical protein